jgi:hypothetical protein
MLRIFRLAPVALLLLGAACTRDPGDPSTGGPNGLRVPSQAPDIIGTVTQATPAGDNVVVRIEQDPTRSAGYPVADVTVSPRTRVLRRSGGGVVAARPAELTAGTPVRAWFTGPVRESWPVQADAETVLIEP